MTVNTAEVKTAEVELRQLKTALQSVIEYWDNLSREITRYNDKAIIGEEAFGIKIGQYGTFAQVVGAISLIIEKVEGLPADAGDDVLRKIARESSAEAADVWE